MPYCKNCGARLGTNDTFCGACGRAASLVGAVKGGVMGIGKQTGTPIESGTEKRKLDRCPACGEIVNLSDFSCSACGYELRRVNEGSIAKLYQRLEEIEGSRVRTFWLFQKTTDDLTMKEKKANAIRNFPIPSTKEDLTEFLVMAKANGIVSPMKTDVESQAWMAVFEQAYDKAECLFGDDDDFDDIQRIKFKAKQEKRDKWVRLICIVLSVILGYALLMILITIGINFTHGS